MFRMGRAVVCAIVLTGVTAGFAQAQPSISLNGSVFAAGPDFATDVYNDAWDFSNVDDLSPFPDEQNGWTTSAQARSAGRGVFLNNGRFQATTDPSAGNKVSLLFRGGAGLMNAGRTGAFDHMAIPTARYGKLAVKMRLTNPGPPPNMLMAIWYHRTYGGSDEVNQSGLALFGAPTNGWAVYILDLPTLQYTMPDGSLQSGTLASPLGGTPRPWHTQSLVRGFELRAQGTAGYTVPVEIDWVRLTARDGAGAATMTVNYANCSGAYTLRVTDAEGVPFAVARGPASGSGSVAFNYGVLAPGAYTASLSCNNGTSSGQAFTVNAPPQVTVIDPDVTGGSDFATDVLGNPWDMADAGDVPVLQGVTGAGLVNDAGLPALQATGTSAGDPAVTLLNGGAALINTRRYRHLTFTLTLDTPFGLDGGQGQGSVARVLWGSRSTSDLPNMTTSNDMMVWPGRNTYTVDLSALTAANGGLETDCAGCLTTPWLSNSVRFFRIDPHEATTGVTFRLAQVKLGAVDEVAAGSTFNVRYGFADADTGSTYTAQIFVDGDRDPSSGLVQVGTMNNVPKNTVLTFPMNTSGIAPGFEYFIYVRIVENRGGLQEVRGGYASGRLLIYSPSSSLPRLTVSSPSAGSSVNTPFSITGCAFDEGNTSGINMDEVSVLAIAGPNVTGVQAGSTQVLGFGGPLGTRSFPTSCPSASGAFANSGFSISGVYALSQGNWTLRVLARSTISGQFTVRDVPVTVVTAAGAPQNFTATASGNTVTVSFTAPTSGPQVGGYIIEAARNPDFVPAAFQVPVPAPGSYSGAIASGTYYFRAVSLEAIGARIAASPAVLVNVGPLPPTPPGPPSLSLAQAASNPITLSWSPGSGGPPTNYTLYAGTSPGASNLIVAPMGGATSISATAPVGVPIYVRVVATNGGGSATSNEVSFTVAAPVVPGPPTLAPASVSGSNVTLSWSPPTSGTAPSGYTLLARVPGSGAVMAALPVTGTSVTVPAPPGTYVVSVVAVNGAGTSAESNQVTVVVR
jgi:hypothetical protein